MKINHIKIKNYKGFENKEFFFPSNFTLIHGANATGKSTILDAISIVIGTFFIGIDGAESKGLKKSEIRRSILDHSTEHQLPVTIEADLVLKSENFRVERILNSLKGKLNYKNSNTLIQFAKLNTEQIRDKEKSNQVQLPLIAYHGTGRLWTGINERKKHAKRSSRLDGYYRCLDPKSIQQRFFHWFRTLEDGALKFGFNKNIYNAFANTIITVVEDWTKIHFNWELDDIVGLTKNNEYRAFENLSDGYKTLITLTADLAYRCIKLNPQLQEKAVTDTEGVVLIDELDMHLHPKWQRDVVAKLKTAFPKIQFIVTSHSPYIIQSLKAEELISLDGEILDHNPKDQSLDFTTAYMGVSSYRSAEFEEKERNAKMVYAKIEAASKQTGKQKDLMLDEIDELIEKYSKDPAYVAQLKFKKLAKLGKD